MPRFTEEQYRWFEEAIARGAAKIAKEKKDDSDSESLPDPELMEVQVQFFKIHLSLS